MLQLSRLVLNPAKYPEIAIAGIATYGKYAPLINDDTAAATPARTPKTMYLCVECGSPTSDGRTLPSVVLIS
jgi:hypothetical protein